MSDRTAEVALHGEREDILRSAVAAAREVVGADVAFAAIQNDRGTYDMSIRDNCTLAVVTTWSRCLRKAR